MRIATWRFLILAALPALFAVSLMGAAVDPPSVIQAAKNGDKDALRALIQKKADVNQAEADGATALHWASYHDDLESTDLLIHAGAKVNAANDLGGDTAVGGQPERKRGHGAQVAGCRSKP